MGAAQKAASSEGGDREDALGREVAVCDETVRRASRSLWFAEPGRACAVVQTCARLLRKRARSHWCELARGAARPLPARAPLPLAEAAGERRSAKVGGGTGECHGRGVCVAARARTRAIGIYRRAKSYPRITVGKVLLAENPVIGELPGNTG